MSQVYNEGSLSISHNKQDNLTDETIGNVVWLLNRCEYFDGTKHVKYHKLRCFSMSALHPGRSIRAEWTARWTWDRHVYLNTSGTHIFGDTSDYVNFPLYYDKPDSTFTVELKILEVHSPVIVSPIECINSKDEETIMELPMQERHAAMLNNPFMSDIAFKVGPERQEVKFFGHKLLLSMTSKVFRAMLMPSHQGLKVPEVIDIPDVHPTAFMTLLRFIYRNETVVELNLIQETLYVGEKYDVKGFLKSMEKYLGPKTVMEFLPLVARVGPTHVLYKKCLSLVKRHLDIKSEAFLQLDPQVLHCILEYDDIKVKEVDLFYAYVKWADERLKDKNIEINNVNRKTIMTDLRLIRFPIMTAEEFTRIISTVDVLTKEQIVEICGFITAKKPTTFITKKRIVW